MAKDLSESSVKVGESSGLKTAIDYNSRLIYRKMKNTVRFQKHLNVPAFTFMLSRIKINTHGSKKIHVVELEKGF